MIYAFTTFKPRIYKTKASRDVLICNQVYVSDVWKERTQ
jgi:hypothetical protein